MPLTCCYVVRPDGDLCRVANIDGSLDHNQRRRTRQALARPGPDKDEPPNQLCSRSGTTVLLEWNGPLMTGVWIELCTVCDAHRPAARAFIDWHADPDRDLTAVPRLFEDWEIETMHAHGGGRAPQGKLPRCETAPEPCTAGFR
ncbi:DUF6300 family protein [Streptomyces sp. NPDC060187]|uniref:DUF6300 family protein n=1 Tax=Streptomyces sp. NPDC060187 TaxID=3347067 RepID=UPI00365FBA08